MKNRLNLEDLSQMERAELFNIWHVSKIYSNKRYDRLIYTVDNFLEENPFYIHNRGSIYKILSENV